MKWPLIKVFDSLQAVTGGQSSPGARQPPHTPMIVAVLSSLETNCILYWDTHKVTSNFRKWNRHWLWTPRFCWSPGLLNKHRAGIYCQSRAYSQPGGSTEGYQWLLYDSVAGKTYTYTGCSGDEFHQGKAVCIQCMCVCLWAMERAIRVQQGQGSNERNLLMDYEV